MLKKLSNINSIDLELYLLYIINYVLTDSQFMSVNQIKI